MKKLLLLIIAAFLSTAPAKAQLSQAQVDADINSMLLSCGTGCNTAASLRSLLDIMVTATFQSQGASGLTISGTPEAGYVPVASSSTAVAWKNLPVIDVVLNYQADPTGATSSSTAFNNAVTACAALTQCTIHVPSTLQGYSYLLSTTVTILASQVFLQCDPGVVIVNGTTNGASLQWGNGSTQYFGGGADGCIFAQASGVTPTSGNYGAVFNKVGQIRVSHLTVTSFPGSRQVQGTRFAKLFCGLTSA